LRARAGRRSVALPRRALQQPAAHFDGRNTMNWYLQALKKYADFSGRARRKEYWFFVLFNIIISIVLSVIDVMLGLGSHGIGILSGLYSLGVIIPSIAVGVRRLHDINKSGWWVLIVFVPFIGALVLLVFALLKGTQGANDYGPDPKAAAA
jgi:uncharacterized membrane protein YhaH (DUF805 family)